MATLQRAALPVTGRSMQSCTFRAVSGLLLLLCVAGPAAALHVAADDVACSGGRGSLWRQQGGAHAVAAGETPSRTARRLSQHADGGSVQLYADTAAAAPAPMAQPPGGESVSLVGSNGLDTGFPLGQQAMVHADVALSEH